MEWIETTGSTVDEAKDRALDRLGIAEDDMQFEIIEEGSNSLFRLKRKEARLRARVKPVNTKPKFDSRKRDKKQGRARKSTHSAGNTKNSTARKNTKKYIYYNPDHQGMSSIYKKKNLNFKKNFISQLKNKKKFWY